MSRYLQFLGTDGINVELSSVNYDPYEQINYLFSLESSYVNNNNIVIPSLVNTVEEQQKTLEGKGTVASVTAGTGMTQIGIDTFNPTLNVIGGDGITANADDITVDSTVVRTTGSQTIAGDKSFSNNVSIDGDITGGSAFFTSVSALTANFLQTIISSTSALSVVNAGTGPALYVQQDGNEPIAHFIDKTGDDIVFADNGFVGIGTFNPAEKLTVSGNISANGSLSATGNATFTGNVGIGTDSQVGKLHVEQLDNNEDALVLKGGGGSGSVQGNVSLSMSHFKGDTNPAVRIMAEERAAADWRANLLFLLRDVSSDAAPTEKMRITYDGKVGIGTASPRALLDVSTAVNGDSFPSRITSTDGSFTDEQKLGIEFAQNAIVLNQFYSKYDISLGGWGFGFKGYSSGLTDELFTIGAGGNVGVGTTSPTEKLTVSGNISANGSLSATGSANIAGDLVVSGSIDGRDVATDGAKLDGIEASADVTDTTNVTSAGALMDSEVTNLAQVKAFDSSDYATAAQGTLATNALPKSGGAMTGAITTNSTFDGVDIAVRDAQLSVLQGLSAANVTGINTTAQGALQYSQANGATNSVSTGLLNSSDVTFNSVDGTSGVAGQDVQIGVTDSGMIDTSSGDLELASAGGNTILGDTTISITNKLGIGTTSPSNKLHIDDNDSTGTGLKVTGGGSGGPLATFTRDVGSTGTIAINSAAGDPQISLASASNTFALGTNGSNFEICDNDTVGTNTRLIIASDGDVGIGTTSPSAKLDIISNHSQLRLEDSDDSKFVLFSYSGGKLVIRNNSTSTTTNQFTLTEDGKFGIGTTGPARPLHVNGGALNFVAEFESTDDKASILIQDDDTLNYIHSQDGYLSLGGQSALSTGNLNIKASDGNVGIGTISPAYPFALENSGTGLIARLYNTNADGDGVLIRAGSTSSATRALQVASTNDTKILTVNSNGRVGITTTSPDYLLDIGGDTSSANNTIRMVQADGGTAIRIGAGGAGNDVNLLRVDGNVSAGGHRGETNSSNFGFSLRYKGSGSGAGNSLAFFVDNLNAASQVEALTILNDGKIGIGIASPEQELHVYQGTAKLESTDGNDVSLQLGRSDNANLWNFNHAGNDLRIYNSGGSGYDVMIGVNSGGASTSNKVGINTASPSHQLDVNGTFQAVGDATFDANVNAGGVITTGGNTEAEVKSWLHAGRQWSFSGLPFFNKTSGSTAQRLDGAFMADLNTGSDASRRAQAVFGAGFNDISGYSGAGTDYSRALGASIKAGFFISGQNSASVIFAVGLASTSGVFADDDPISNYGFGVEFRRGSGSVYEWRVFAHDGTSFTASTFTSTGITYSLDPRTIAIYSDGAGNITAYTALYGSTSYTTATTTGGPTATSGTSTSTNFVGLRCNTNASSYVAGAHAKARAIAVNLFAE